MSTYVTEQTIEGPFPSSTPLEDLVDFYRANGYRVLYETNPSPNPLTHDQPDAQEDQAHNEVDSADPEAEQPFEATKLSRGHDTAGWWSSNMTRLPTRIDVRPSEQAIEIRYEVDTTGQRLTEEDRDFWSQELRAAAQYLRNPSRQPRDLRHEEAKRAEQIRRRMLSYGIWGAIIAFFLVLLVNRFFGMT